MVWVRSPVYFYKRNDTFYFSRAVTSDLRHRFNKKKIEVSLRTKSEAKAAKSAAALRSPQQDWHNPGRNSPSFNLPFIIPTKDKTQIIKVSTFKKKLTQSLITIAFERVRLSQLFS